MTALALEPATDDVLGVFRRNAQNPSAFLALNDGNEFFAAAGVDGVVPYRAIGRRYWVQFAGPCAGPYDRGLLWKRFLQAAEAEGRRVIAVQLHANEAQRAAWLGWTVNQFGTSYSIDLSDFTLQGKKFVKTRNMITRSRREGVAVSEARVDDPDYPGLSAELDEIDRTWLRDKGWHVKELEFLVGQRGGRFQESRRLFVARWQGSVVGYVSYSPVFGDRPGWLYDLTRRRPDAPPGVIEHIFFEAAQQLAAEGADWMHLGLTPFVGLDAAHDLGATNQPLGKLVRWIGGNASWLYPSAGQVAFKLKWRPQLVTPEYIAVPGTPRLRDGLCLARATNAV
jgi:lysylphosphatidylglycerol synthetase-like protein (DUF2156 family)